MANSPLPPSNVVGGPAAAPGGGTTGVSSETSIFPPQPSEPIEIRGTPGNDVLIGSAQDENIWGFRGDDLLFGGGGSDRLDGGIGSDVLAASPGFDFYVGGPGSDTVTFSSAPGPAVVDVNFGSVLLGDNFQSLQQVENLTGSPFGDTLQGNDDDNVLNGGGGLDLLNGRLGDDVLNGGSDGAYASWADSQGGVRVDLEAGTATEWDGGRDTLANIVGAVGSAHDDVLRGDADANRLEGGAGNDRLDGRGGDDVLSGGPGADRLVGGAGNDTADYSGAGPVRANLSSGQAVDDTGARDTLRGIENLIGSYGHDVLSGNAAANRLVGGIGADTLRGGAGPDTFVYNDRLDFGDTIRDFQTGQDKIEVARAVAGDGTFSFDSITHHLLWQDGGNPVVVATLQGAAFSSGDLQIV